MARRICQFLLTLAVLYGLAVGAYATFGYAGERPDLLTIASEMQGWVVGRFADPPPAPPPAGTVPPRREAPATELPVDPPPQAPTPPPPEASGLDERGRTLSRVENVLLPRAEREAKSLADRSAPDFEEKRSTVLVTLTEARDLLGPILDRRRDDPEAQRLYKRVSDLLIAVKKR